MASRPAKSTGQLGFDTFGFDPTAFVRPGFTITHCRNPWCRRPHVGPLNVATYCRHCEPQRGGDPVDG